MKSRRRDSALHREYPSAWQRHRDNGCGMDCFYCVQARKFRDLSWRFIPSDKYAAFTRHERERKLNEHEERERMKTQSHSSIIRPQMIVPGNKRGA